MEMDSNMRQPPDDRVPMTDERCHALVESLRQSEEQYREIVKKAPVAIYEIDFRTGRFTSVNDTTCILSGYSREELLAMNALDLLLEPDRIRFRERMEAWLTGDKPPGNIEYRMKDKAGRIRDIVLSVTYTRDRSGQPLGAAGFGHDVTERKRLENDVVRKELLLRTIIHSASDILFIKDRESRVVFVNEAYGRLFKVDIASIIGKDDYEIYRDPAIAAPIIENDREVMQTGKGHMFEEQVNTPAGPLYFQFYKTPWRNDQGEIIGIVGSGMDITERKRLEIRLRNQAEDLAQADRNKNQFLSMLSHELRNPLAAIVMSIDLLGQLVGDEELLARSIRVLKPQTGQLTHLVDDLLDVTRITANKIQLKTERVELVSLVQRVIGDYQFQFEGKGIASAFSTDGGSITLMADPVRLTQIVGNLVHNAIKYSRRGDRVLVRVERTGDGREATIRISDTGSGIEPDLLPHLFEPFSQADRSLARSQGGLGLGLSIVKGMVDLHGGSGEATDQGPGQGPDFHVRPA